MKGKFLFVVGLGVGYVLGTRAGRERYEQIRRAAESVWNQPTVQEGVQTAKDFAMARVGDVGDTVLDGAKKLVRQVTGSQGSSTGSGSGSTSTASKSTASKATASKSTASKSTASKSSGSKSTGSGSGSSTAKSGSGSSSSSSSS